MRLTDKKDFDAIDRFYHSVVNSLEQDCDLAVLIPPERPIQVVTIYLSLIAAKRRVDFEVAIASCYTGVIVAYKPPGVFPFIRHIVQLYGSLIVTFAAPQTAECLEETFRAAVEGTLLSLDE